MTIFARHEDGLLGLVHYQAETCLLCFYLLMFDQITGDIGKICNFPTIVFSALGYDIINSGCVILNISRLEAIDPRICKQLIKYNSQGTFLGGNELDTSNLLLVQCIISDIVIPEIKCLHEDSVLDADAQPSAVRTTRLCVI